MAKDYDAGDTAGIFNTDIAHCITSSTHMCIFPSVPQCKHPSQPALQKRITWNSGAKCISKKRKKEKEICFAVSEANSNSSNVDESKYNTALQNTEACPDYVHTSVLES